MGRCRYGFSLIELVVAILIGSILTSIALSSFGNVRGRFAVRGARNTFVALHARARAQAIELGERVTMGVDVSNDRVSLVDASGDTLEMIPFDGEMKVDIRATSNFRICMNSRGYADTGTGCMSSATNVEFWQNTDSATVRILTLGQLIY